MSIVRGVLTLRSLVPLVGLVFVTGCAGGTGAQASESAAAPTQAAQDDDGLMLFADRCGDCHTLVPPDGNAPAMSTIMRRYTREYGPDLRAAMVFWLRYPDAEWAAMPNQILETHGVMPSQDLTLEEVEGIVDYLLDSAMPGSVR
ncbi:MAG: cytochrome c [Gemmatimonadota bacterium]|jgi:mono/diheme cytochrome c family protein